MMMMMNDDIGAETDAFLGGSVDTGVRAQIIALISAEIAPQGDGATTAAAPRTRSCRHAVAWCASDDSPEHDLRYSLDSWKKLRMKSIRLSISCMKIKHSYPGVVESI